MEPIDLDQIRQDRREQAKYEAYRGTVIEKIENVLASAYEEGEDEPPLSELLLEDNPRFDTVNFLNGEKVDSISRILARRVVEEALGEYGFPVSGIRAIYNASKAPIRTYASKSHEGLRLDIVRTGEANHWNLRLELGVSKESLPPNVIPFRRK